MAVIPLESLPLGFRFHPTDEELVNHYLKRKINGWIRSEIEVIPEIDVCKCEPWDLPDKALIRSEDPEWFFFSPKDRKYPNGHRSNRATEAGYWKATGKDRTIRTKAPLAPVVIGIKKTLVFHRGRAPKGVRTNWIMHEYRVTDPEFESGEQGGYVLYRLFRKTEEKSPGCNGDEVEQHGLSPTPTKSSPCDTQHDADAFEEFGTPIMAEPLNQVSPFSDTWENPQSLLAKENPPSGITRWLADKDDRSLKPPDDHCNNHVAVEQEAEAGAVGDLGLHDPGWFNMDTSSARYENASFLPYDNNGPDVYSVDSGAESLQELFNSMKESDGHVNVFSNEVGLREETGNSGIKIRTTQPWHPTIDNLSTEQGFTRRRIRLQAGAISSTQIDSSTKKEIGGEANVEVEDIKEQGHDPCIKLNDLPSHDNIVPSLNIEESHPSKTELKLRTRSTKGSTKFDKVRREPILGLQTSKSDVAMGYIIWLIVSMTILMLLCVGIWRWRSSSLWISGVFFGDFP